MHKRMAGSVLAVVLAGGASPALADCCSDVIGCVAAVVTYGVSCEVQAIIDTIKTLVTEVSNLVSSVDGSAQAEVKAAKQTVSDTYNGMLSQTQQSSGDLAAAASQAQNTLQAEVLPRVTAKVASSADPGNRIGSADTQNATPYDRQSSPVAPAGNSAGSAGPGPMTATIRTTPVQPVARASAGPPGNPAQAQTTLATAGPPAATVASQLGAPTAYANIFRRAQQTIDALKQKGDADAAKVNGYLATALSSEGPGLISADQMIANIINAPLNNMLDYLNGLLAHPLTIVEDPSSATEALEKSVTDNLDYSLDAVKKAIVSGPQANFDLAQPGYDELATIADQAQAIAAAMQRLYQQRTKGAYDALDALLPRDLSVLHSATPQRAILNSAASGSASRRLTYAQLRAPILSRDAQSQTQIKARTQHFKTVLARFEVQRIKARTPASPAVVQGYQNSATQKLNGYFTGRTPAQIGQQRDQLVAQARTRFANDPKTGNAVVSYLNDDVSKRSSGSVVATALPGAPPAAALGTQAPVAPRPAPSSQNPPVAWGAAGAWKPPVSPQAAPATVYPTPPAPGTTAPGTAVPAGSVYRQSSGLKTGQPAAPASIQRTVPSSLGSN